MLHNNMRYKICDDCGSRTRCPPLTACTTHGMCARCGSSRVRYRDSFGMLVDQLERLWIVIKRS